MTIACCHICKFFQFSNANGEGFCRKNPPAPAHQHLFTSPGIDDVGRCAVWPVVLSEDWCGAFEKQAPEAEPAHSVQPATGDDDDALINDEWLRSFGFKQRFETGKKAMSRRLQGLRGTIDGDLAPNGWWVVKYKVRIRTRGHLRRLCQELDIIDRNSGN